MISWMLLVVLLLAVDLTQSDVNGARWNGRNRKPAWWQVQSKEQGPYVCAIEKVPGTTRSFFSPWTGGTICGKPTIVRFECCEGFSLTSTDPGCSLVKPLENLVDTIRDNRATMALAHAVRESGLHRPLATEGPFTLFAPVNHAFLNASEELIYLLNRKTALQGAPPSLLMYHLVPNRIMLSDLKNEMQLSSLYYNHPVRVNKFVSGLVTINCIPLVSVDQEVANGVVHTVESILKPPTQNTITDHIVRDPLFSRMATLLVQTKMTSLLRERGPFTVFVPNDNAFFKLEEQEAIMNDEEALTALFQYHIVDRVWCSSSVSEKAKVKTLEGSEILVSCNETGKYVNDALIVQGDIMTTNGFIHVINRVLLPQKAKSLRRVAEELELRTLLSLMHVAALDNVLLNSGKFTIFAPTDAAFDELSNQTVANLFANPVLLQDLLMSHLVPNRQRTNNFMDKQQFSTLKLMHRLRIKRSRKRLTVEGAVVENGDHDARNGIIHVIDKVLFPPTKTVAQYLESAENLTIFTNALNQTASQLLEVLNSTKGSFTVFAPDNYGFSLLPPGHVTRLLNDVTILNSVMNDHIVEDWVPVAGLLKKVYYPIQTRSRHTIQLREDEGLVTAGIAIIQQQDIVCTNGIVHQIDRLLQLAV